MTAPAADRQQQPSPKWYEQPIRITRDGYGYHISNGDYHDERRLPERHYWPKTAN